VNGPGLPPSKLWLRRRRALNLKKVQTVTRVKRRHRRPPILRQYNPTKGDKKAPFWYPKFGMADEENQLRGLTPGCRRFYEYLKDRAGEDGCFSQPDAEVAKSLGMSKRSVIRYRKELASRGLIRVIQPGGGRGKPVRIQITGRRAGSRPQEPPDLVERGLELLQDKEAQQMLANLGASIGGAVAATWKRLKAWLSSPAKPTPAPPTPHHLSARRPAAQPTTRSLPSEVRFGPTVWRLVDRDQWIYEVSLGDQPLGRVQILRTADGAYTYRKLSGYVPARHGSPEEFLRYLKAQRLPS